MFKGLKKDQGVFIEVPEVLGPQEIRGTVLSIHLDTMEISCTSPQLFKRGMSIWVRYNFADETHTFEARIKNVSPIDGIITIIPARQVELRGKRGFYRMDTMIPVTFFLWSRGEQELSGIIKNLSGGGMVIATDFPTEINDLARVNFKLSKEVELKDIGAKVIKVNRKEHAEKEWELILEFTKINTSQQDEIVHYIFQKEMELRRKGLR